MNLIEELFSLPRIFIESIVELFRSMMFQNPLGFKEKNKKN